LYAPPVACDDHGGTPDFPWSGAMTAAAASPPTRDRMSYARELIEFYEGFRSHAYKCPAGKCTIGWGHTGSDVRPGMVISRATGEKLLDQDMIRAADAVADMVRVPLSEQQYGALISWVFNCGASATKDSTVIFLVNQKKLISAADALMHWNHVDGDVSRGLTKRRMAEKRLFLEGVV
jgi:lysozyme